MEIFKDNLSQPYKLALTLPKVRRIRDELGIDLLNPQHQLQVQNSLTDRLTVVYLLCREQADELNIRVDEFEERLSGDDIANDASAALLQELANFSRKFGMTAAAMMIEKNAALMAEAQKRNLNLIETGELFSVLDQAAGTILSAWHVNSGNGSPDGPQLSESPPAG